MSSFNSYLAVVLVFINLWGCSSSKIHKKKKGVQQASVETVEQAPEWVYGPSKGCLPMRDLCASGEGESMLLADTHARQSLAAIFETRIETTLEETQTSTSENSIPLESFQSVSKELKLTVDQLLKGVEIQKRAVLDGLYFSLAVLDKRAASRELKQKIQKLDERMRQDLKLQKRSLYGRLMESFTQRSILNERYLFLTGSALPELVSLGEIKDIKYGKSANTQSISVKWNSDIKSSVGVHMQNALASFGHTIIPGNATTFDRQLNAKIMTKPEYLNVNGFKKFSFVLSIETFNPAGKKVGGLTLEKTAVGRTKKDAFKKVEPTFKSEVKNSIEKLNLD